MTLAQTAAQDKPPAQASVAPKLEVSSSVWDFGEKWSGEKAETTLTLKNVGDAPLHIERVQSSCGCTTAQVDNKVLQPGQTEEFRVSYSTTKRTENVRQKILVYSDDPANPVTMIQVRGRVRQLLELSPPNGLSFGPLGRDETVTKSVQIKCTYTAPITLRLEESEFDHLNVRLEEIEAGKRYELTATTKPPMPDGLLSAYARLLTGLELVPEYPLRISGSVQAPVAVMPNKLYVASHMGKSSLRSLRVTSRREQPLVVKNVTASLPAIKTEVLPANTGGSNAATRNEVIIRVTLPPASEIPAQGGQITIITNDAEYSELVVPVLKQAVAARSREVKAAAQQEPEANPTQRPQAEKP
jgi:hypothetical protein